MIQLMKTLRYLITIFVFFLLAACQIEENSVTQQDTNAFLKSSPIAGLLSRTSQNPTALDNVLDNSSMIKMQLPATVTVNGNDITVNTSADYQLVQDAIDAYPTDDDIVHCHFPMVIEFQNYSTQTVYNYTQMHDAIQGCGEDDHFDEIACISLVYPIRVNVYDTDNQIANTFTMEGNSNLFNFLANLNNSTYVGIDYPISAIDANSQTIVLNSNAELMDFIENSIDECEDMGGNSPMDLNQLLVNNNWHITYCLYYGVDKTAYYQGYDFDYNGNGTVTAQKNSITTQGDWDINDDNGFQRLSLNFDGSDLHDIETNWRVVEYSDTVIKLKKQNSNNNDYLTFTKNQ
ncbi:hypothetical protein [Flavobacterium wongokense]|uniref:hypothetical protein n=1 Tax=Flavobacterium wongokense TaxID=2910674 RepID=UPI001F1F81D8|nr:hypothetical protein [Flavobacterium sp. WG47]MCF6132956.1 hypothetical protein [Flavobacterium sp. WG47]